MNDTELNRNLYLLQRYQEQIEALYGEAEIVEGLANEYRRTIETLQELTSVDSKDTFVPIGGNTFAYGEITAIDKVIVNVGRGILIEKPINAAIDTLTKKIADVKKSQDSLAKTINDIRIKIDELTQKIKDKDVQVPQKKD